ncbi:hypothetical protein M2163_008518 [Streptomyces sp. SAI-135]|uniref:hypothetical protein n=1 Tax=unclassified Streptomyces TaxID=2593676 RepID=UPI0024761568|nr:MULTISPECIES: hypothetical protein [unclassified Streptomyces]MDH6514506.1 hypothetical protein [Streptomyces sp. SAI-090]MDH6621410.1 hypothetical protein [Streptomyces sp. SAI-135]
MTTGPTAPLPNEPAIPMDRSYGDPVGDLVRAAVADRPLEDVVHLITLLEQSPQYAQATGAALRAVGVDRSVEDVTRLVSLLTRPPRDADSADEAIRAAAESRPVEDVTRLVALLSRSELRPHCGQEAVRAAATGRPVEELVELIGRLATQEPPPPPAEAPAPYDEQWRPGAEMPGAFPAPPPHPPGAGRIRRAPAWPGRIAALALLVCGALCFPAQRYGASAQEYGIALGVSLACVLLALLTLRPVLPVLALAVVVPAAVAAGQVIAGRFGSAGLARALESPPAPAWLVGTAAVCASLAALTALVVHLASAPSPERVLAERRTAQAIREAADAPMAAQPTHSPGA